MASCSKVHRAGGGQGQSGVVLREGVGGGGGRTERAGDTERWKEVLRTATQVVEFELNNVIRELGVPSADSKTSANARKIPRAILERVLPLLARIESASDQSYFVRQISDKASIPADAVWQDLKMVIKKMKEKEVATPVSSTTSGVGSVSNSSKSSMIKNPRHRIDLAERQLFGMIFVIEKSADTKLNLTSTAKEYREQLKKISGDTYENRVARAEAMKSDLMFEAEEYFGSDQKTWERHMKELLINFEEDVLNEDLLVAMQELRTAEKSGDQSLVQECAKKCQVLSIRKAEIAKKRG